MKRVFLVMVVSAMLATLGLAQAPDAGSSTDPANVKGCLGGTDGNYTVAEDGTRQIFKITTSSVDLKPHVGHAVKLTGHKTSGAVGSGAADNSFAVTELNMVSEHCAAASAAPAGTVIPPSETVITPTEVAAAPSPAPAAAPAATSSTPTADTAAPAATVSTPAVAPTAPAATVSTPVVDTAAPAAPASPSSATVSTPVAEAARPERPSAHAHKLAATKIAAAPAPDPTVSPSPETVSPPAADAPTPAATVSPSVEAVSAPAAAAPDAVAPAPAVTHRAGSLTLLISFVVLVIVLGTMAPLIGRWRKRKMLERSGNPNLSFTNEASTNEASSEQDKPEPLKVA